MVTKKWDALKEQRLEGMTSEEREEYECAYAKAKLAGEVGERVRAARETAGLSQRDLARRIGTSQAVITRLEAGGVGATLTTLQRVATALELEVKVELRPTV